MRFPIRRLLPVLAVAVMSASTPDTVTLTTSPSPSIFGQPVTLTASVSPTPSVSQGDPTGKVTFYDGETMLGTRTLASGEAVLTTNLLSSGARSLQTYYSGDAHYAPNLSARVTQNVRSLPANGFASPVNYPAGTSAAAIAIGDFNGDGKADLAVASQGDNFGAGAGVSVLLGNGDGSFHPAVTYATDSTPYFVAVGDFNGDGYTDLAVANGFNYAADGGTVSVLLNKGDGTFRPAVNYSTDAHPVVVRVGDLNGDGIADLVVTNRGTEFAGSVSVLLGNGDGTFQTAVNYAGACQTMPFAGGTEFTCQHPFDVAIADFNGDGKADLAFTDAQNLNVLLGNGDGTFQKAITYPAGDTPSYFAVGDFNGDGKADVDVLNFSSGTTDVLLGNGDGSFRSPVAYHFNGGANTSTNSISVADFTGDGKLDLIVGTNSGFVEVLPGNGDGTFQPALKYATGFLSYAVVGEFNGDGMTDLAAVSGGATVLLGSQGLPTATTLMSSLNPSVYGQNVTLTATVSPPSATGNVTFSEGMTVLGTAPMAGGSAVLDIASLPSGNHNLSAVYGGDLTYAGSAASNLMQTVNLAAAMITLSTSANPSTYGQMLTLTASISPPDSSGTVTFTDGSATLGTRIVTNGQASLSTAFLSAGSHSLTAAYSGDANHASAASPVLTETVNQGMVTTPAVTLISSANPATFGQSLTLTAILSPASTGGPDISGEVSFYDGATVLATEAVANGQAGFTTNLLASGTRSLHAYYSGSAAYTVGASPTILEAVNTLPATGFHLVANTITVSNPTAIAVADFNEDGIADVAVTNSKDGTVSVLAGNGDGTFSTGMSYSVGGDPNSIVTGDFNADGHTDLAIGNGIDISVLLGNGDGTFQPPVHYSPGFSGGASGVFIEALTSADLNGDGIADVAVVGIGGLTVLLGNGDGTFQPGVQVSSVGGNAVVAGDFNGDGIPDLIVASAGCTGFCVSFAPGGVFVLLGYGDGTFRTPVAYNAAGNSLAVGDFNGDGIPDLALGYQFIFKFGNQGSVSVLLGNGDGTFKTGGTYIVPGQGVLSVVAADFNGDGIIDLGVVSQTTIGSAGNVVVLQGEGDGTFLPGVAYSARATGVIAVADFNGDGRADIANASPVALSVLLGAHP